MTAENKEKAMPAEAAKASTDTFGNREPFVKTFALLDLVSPGSAGDGP